MSDLEQRKGKIEVSEVLLKQFDLETLKIFFQTSTLLL